MRLKKIIGKNFLKLLLSIIIVIFINCGKENDSIENDDVILIKTFSHISDRATAYPENNKIISIGNGKIFTYLDKNLRPHIIYTVNRYEIDHLILDTVETNHGGGTLVKMNNKEFCYIYDGHIKDLNVKCFFLEDGNISLYKDFSLGEVDKEYNNPYPFWQTYPYAISDGKYIFLLYREELGSLRYPRLVLIKLDVNNEKILYKKIIFSTQDFYANFIGTFVKVNENIYILFRWWGYNNPGDQPFNKGVYIAKYNEDNNSLDVKQILKGDNNDLSVNYYISNLINYRNYLTFTYTLYNTKKFFLCKINPNFIETAYCKEISSKLNLKDKEIFSTSLNIANSDDKIIYACVNVKTNKEWDTENNKVVLLKLDLDNKIYINKIFSDFGWFPI